MFKGKLKSLKIVLKAQNMRFLQQNQVANKSPSQAAKHLRDKIFEKFSKCFLWLEGAPMRQSRRGPQKLLYNITTRASTRKQVAKKPLRQNLKILSKCFSRLEGPHVRKSQRELWNFLSIPHDWSFHSRTSRQTELQGI